MIYLHLIYSSNYFIFMHVLHFFYHFFLTALHFTFIVFLKVYYTGNYSIKESSETNGINNPNTSITIIITLLFTMKIKVKYFLWKALQEIKFFLYFCISFFQIGVNIFLLQSINFGIIVTQTFISLSSKDVV